MPHGTEGQEKKYRNYSLFQDVKPAETFSVNKISRRDSACIFERHNYYPADYFFFNYEGIQYFGRKTLSKIFLDGKQPFKKCNQITDNMIIGMVLRIQYLDKGIVVFFKPLENDEKVFLFNYMKSNPKADLHFPFPVLINGLRESVQNSEAWDPGDELPDTLNVGEEHIRAYTLELMSRFDLTDKVVYDPACSTGKFLGSIKERFPQIHAIGQDLNPDMVKYAKKHSRIDEVHHGDSLYPCVEKESVDFLFFRFLNLSVVSSQQALQYFTKISPCCKIGGTLIVFGFTPVLIGVEMFELLGLKVEQTTAYSKENDSVFQYYVLTKIAPSKTLRYENFSAYHLAKNKGEGKDIEEPERFECKL